MSTLVRQPNVELAVELLAAGRDVRVLRRFCGFHSVRAAREFALSYEVRTAVAEIVRERVARVGARSLERLQGLLDSPTTDGRTLVAAARTGLEISGMLRKDAALPVKNVRDLTVAELDEMITATKREIAAKLRQQPIN